MAKNAVNLLFWRLRSSQVIAFGVNRKRVNDFLLVILLVLSLGDPFRIHGKALRILKLQSFRQLTVKMVILACTGFD